MALERGAGLGLAVMAAVIAAAPALAGGVSDAEIRAFVARQERAWNAGALDAYFTGFTPDAVFTDQYRTPSGEVVPYGSSTLAQAQGQSRRFRAGASIVETSDIERITVAADGRTAQVISRVLSRIRSAKGLRVTCAERRQDLVLAAGRLRSKGQTDTFARCRSQAARPAAQPR